MKKLSMKVSAGLATIGVVIVAIGSYSQSTIGLNTRLAGVIVTTAGLVGMGKRVYERIKEKAKEKAELLRKARALE